MYLPLQARMMCLLIALDHHVQELSPPNPPFPPQECAFRAKNEATSCSLDEDMSWSEQRPRRGPGFWALQRHQHWAFFLKGPWSHISWNVNGEKLETTYFSKSIGLGAKSPGFQSRCCFPLATLGKSFQLGFQFSLSVKQANHRGSHKSQVPPGSTKSRHGQVLV